VNTETVVRIRSSSYTTRRGIRFVRDIEVLKRKSDPDPLFLRDIEQTGVDALESIVNFQTVKDGVYRLIVTREHRDWETGLVEDWRYELVPENE